MALSRLSELSQTIARNTSLVEQYYLKNGLPLPSFEVGAPTDTTLDEPTVECARIAVMEATIELRDLLDGPTMLLRPVLNATSLQAICRFNLPVFVPADDDISYEDLAGQCHIDTDILRRIVRFAIAHHRIFQEKREGYVSHSATSKLLADSEDAMAAVEVMFDSTYKAFARTVDAMQKYTRPTPTRCGWTLAHQVDIPMWEFNAQDPHRRDQWSRAMRQFTRGFGHETTSLLYGWDWASLDQRTEGGLVVDLGGANGHASVLLADEYPNLRFEVQDLPQIIEMVQSEASPEVQKRITFKAHDFKQSQPTQADVYLLRQILHDWPNAQCVQILRALIPALKPGARVVLNDTLITAPGTTSPLVERHLRSIDMIVMTLAGAKERDKSEWEALFNEADGRFTDIKTCQPEGCCMAIIEATWSG